MPRYETGKVRGRRFWSVTPTRKEVEECLRQFEERSPNWVAKIRAYITDLETKTRRGGKPARS